MSGAREPVIVDYVPDGVRQAGRGSVQRGSLCHSCLRLESPLTHQPPVDSERIDDVIGWMR